MIPEGFEIFPDGRVKNHRGEWQKFAQMPRGYFQFVLSRNGKQTCYAVHRLVCEAFHGPRPSPKHQVRHLDGNPQNNRADNLCWGTAKENGEDRVRHGTVTAKLTWDRVREIRQRYAAGGETTRSLGAEFGVSAMTINKVIRNIFWVDHSYTPPTR